MRTLLVVALTLGGCAFDPSVSASLTDADLTQPDADPFAPDADPAAPDATPTIALVNSGLVARYFMDEAANGKAPSELLDSAPDPVSLPISYGQALYTEVNGNRGLRWTAIDGTGKAQINLGLTKLRTEFYLSARVTIEIVVDIDAGSDNNDGSQLAGLRGGNPDFMLAAYGNNEIRFYRPFGSLGATWENVHSNDRMVLHLVYDARDSNADNRIELFKDGTKIAKTSSSPPDQFTTVALGGNDKLMIGNNPNSDASLAGTIFYVAMYKDALSDGDVANNAARLLADDDQ